MPVEQTIIEGVKVYSSHARKHDAREVTQCMLSLDAEHEAYWREEHANGRLYWESTPRDDGTRSIELFHVGEFIAHVEVS